MVSTVCPQMTNGLITSLAWPVQLEEKKQELTLQDNIILKTLRLDLDLFPLRESPMKTT